MADGLEPSPRSPRNFERHLNLPAIGFLGLRTRQSPVSDHQDLKKRCGLGHPRPRCATMNKTTAATSSVARRRRVRRSSASAILISSPHIKRSKRQTTKFAVTSFEPQRCLVLSLGRRG